MWNSQVPPPKKIRSILFINYVYPPPKKNINYKNLDRAARGLRRFICGNGFVRWKIICHPQRRRESLRLCRERQGKTGQLKFHSTLRLSKIRSYTVSVAKHCLLHDPNPNGNQLTMQKEENSRNDWVLISPFHKRKEKKSRKVGKQVLSKKVANLRIPPFPVKRLQNQSSEWRRFRKPASQTQSPV